MKNLIIFLSLAAVATAGELTFDFVFPAPSLSANAAGETVVVIDGCDTRHVPGEARLPFLFVRQPVAGRVLSVAGCDTLPPVVIPINAPVEVAGGPVSMDGGGAIQIPAVSEKQPYNTVEYLGVQQSRRESFVMLRINPLEYDGEKNELVFHPAIRVTIETEDAVVMLAAKNIVNPADYLLVTSETFTNAFAPFVAMKEQRHGLNVIVSTIEDILATQSGADDAEKLRNHIRDVYNATEFRYLLLGGDSSVIPCRIVWCQVGSHTVTNVPTDMYYACLDGSWNGNGNGLWGEPDDGDEPFTDIDLMPELAVGRAPAANVGEVENFVAKCLRYENGGHIDADRALFLAEYLGTVNVPNDPQAGRALDVMAPDFTTAGFSIEWLDDRPVNGQTWFAADALNALESTSPRPHIVAHYGHAGRTSNMHISSSQAASLANEYPFLAVSAGCDSGAFDYANCFARQIVCGGEGGAFAGVYNSRFGWFDNTLEWMYSGEYMSKFFNRLLIKNDATIGDALINSKTEMLGKVTDTGLSSRFTYRWLWFGITLFGDPHSPLKTDSLQIPATPASPISYSGYMGGEFSPVNTTFDFTLSNCVTSDLPVAVSMPAWLDFPCFPLFPLFNEIVIPGDSSTNLTFSPSPAAYSFPPGTHTGNIVFSNTVSRRVKSYSATFTVSPNIRFQTTALTTMEGGPPPAPLVVQRLDSALAPVSVDYAALSGTALAGVDFAPCAGTLTFGVGENAKQIQLTIIDDEIEEPEKTFTVALFNPQGAAALAAQSNVVVTLLDNDHLAGFDISAVPSPQHAGRPFDLQLTARNLTGGILTQYAGEPLLYAADHASRVLTDDIYHGLNFTGEEYPFYHYERVARTQVVYDAAKIGGPGLLTGLFIWQVKHTAMPLADWTIRIKHTALSSFNSPNNSFQADGWTVVHRSNMPVGPIIPSNSNGYDRYFAFDPPFLYDGVSNLMIDFSTRNKSTLANPGITGYSDYPNVRTIRGWSSNYNSDPLTWSGSAYSGFVSWNKAPVIFFERHQPLAFAPPRVAGFIDGIWRGDVSALAPCANTFLLMGDPAKGKGGWDGTFAVSAPLAGFDAPLAWLAHHGLTAEDWFVDSDDDGSPNWLEWLAGTDPHNPHSRFITESANITTNGFEIRWPYAPGRSYTVERAPALTSAFSPLASGITTNNFTDASALINSNGFYRVRIE
ncbi:MAG: C25 family cysteine peptidase [Kiritimatiellaeota bacterium]|nr:C25 family cysteine peptidase [Kiritimatiellota bacterium]